MVITGRSHNDFVDQFGDIHSLKSDDNGDRSVANDGKNDNDQIPETEDDQQTPDYFTFKYQDGSIDFNDSMNFDSKKFIDDVKKTLSRIKSQAEAHKFKLFICQAFKIPMDDLVVNQSSEKFSQTLGNYVSKFDTDKLDADVGSSGVDSDFLSEDDSQSDDFDEGI